MYRATTPTLTYNFSGASPDDFADILITISQAGKIIFTRHKNECQIDGDAAAVELSQEEANMLLPGKASTQVRAITPEGKVHASDIISFRVERVLNDAELEVPDE